MSVYFEFHEGMWYEQLMLIELLYNYHFGVRMSSFETLRGRRCRIPLWWQEIDDALKIGPELIQEAMQNICVFQE